MKKPNRICQHPGCNGKSPRKFCDQHQKTRAARYKEQSKRYDRDRGTTAERGYGGRWQKFRKLFLFDHPWCVECEKLGRLVAATVVDHVVPHKGNDELMWDEENMQALCETHHNAKTGREIVREGG